MATQSLYRRYRPRRFGELKGQDHVVRALRDAVAHGRAGQAYLFSGPRGTGKTTSARILAKALNCEQVVDGEPCCECDSCLAVEQGTSYDVHELDAASNNGVDAIRDLVERASLGNPGRHKVYILDEVHMLSKAAEAALLKTLEEPPPHVVFVLATTDPHKMSDTIRSRTQHLQFHLLPADTLADHVRWVADDAGYEIDQAALDAAVAQGGGSPRDTLSALELIAATGGTTTSIIDLDAVMAALIERDAGHALTAMAEAINQGHDPRMVTEQLVRHLRDAFLSLMAPDLVVLPSDRVAEISDQARRLGPASLVKAIERLGTALVEMRFAPDPRILAEIALVQLTRPSVDNDLDEVMDRIDRIEARLKTMSQAPPTPTVPTDPSTGRAVLGGRARRTSPPSGDRKPPSSPTASTPSPPADPPADQAPTPAESPSTLSVPEAWESVVKPSVKPFVRALYSAGSFVGERDGTWEFAVPSAIHAEKTEKFRGEVEQALSEATGTTVTINFVVTRGGESGSPRPATAEPNRPVDDAPAPTPSDAGPPPDTEPAATTKTAPADEEIDLDELTDAPPSTAKTPLDRLSEAFPGSRLIKDD